MLAEAKLGHYMVLGTGMGMGIGRGLGVGKECVLQPIAMPAPYVISCTHLTSAADASHYSKMLS